MLEMFTGLTGETLHRCESCGKLVESLNEAEDYVWVCNDCFKIYNESLIDGLLNIMDDPDCMIS